MGLIDIEDSPSQNIKVIDTDSIRKIAIFLEGYKQGKGNILPLGLYDLEQLWDTVKYMQGSDLVTTERKDWDK